MSRLRLLLALAAFAAGAVASSAAAETPAGPRLGYEQSAGGGEESLLTAAPGGLGIEALVRFPRLQAPLSTAAPPADPSGEFSWAPDGKSFAYAGYASLRKGGGVPSDVRIYVQSVDGGPAIELPGSVGGRFPVFAPDGSAIAVLRRRLVGSGHAGHRAKEESSIWLLRLDGGAPRRLTPWRGVYRDLPNSFQPGGAALAIVSTVTHGRSGHRRTSSEAVALRLDGSGATRIATKAGEVAYSPDGTSIALIRSGQNGGLWVGAADGSGLRRIDSRVDSSPSWDPSGGRIAFLAQGHGGNGPLTIGGFGNTLNEINPDGSCLVTIAGSTQLANHSPRWQPGPGRGAGPIAC